jgi:quercetin dioxygenase-like cupin family protein
MVGSWSESEAGPGAACVDFMHNAERLVTMQPPTARGRFRMQDPPNEEVYRRPHPQPMASPYLEFDLASELAQLHREPGWQTGQNGKTLVKYDDLRIALTALKSGRRIAEHQTEARISIQTFVGHLQVRAEGRTFSLPAGTLLALDRGLPHEVEALEDSAFLLTIAWPGRGDRRNP